MVTIFYYMFVCFMHKEVKIYMKATGGCFVGVDWLCCEADHLSGASPKVTHA
jgi:hypothetical protein